MEMGPGHLVSSGNLLCPLSRTADFEHEVADANQQTLISFQITRTYRIHLTCLNVLSRFY